MTNTVPCPEADRLQDLLDGRLPEAEQADLIGHLDRCDRCQQALERLATGEGDASWAAGLGHLGGEPSAGGPVLRALIAELGRNAGAVRAETGSLSSLDPRPETGEEPTLDFLDPPETPGHLGTLDHYAVIAVIGRGGMGVVLKAFDPALHRFVAIKVLAPQLATSPAARQRFAREVRAAAAVSHEHVVAIHAVSEVKGLPYLVMEYIHGPSLQEKIDRAGPLELKEILRIGMQAASALAAAHAQGLVHRDVKPGNILLENGVERVKITDFGLARAIDDATLTQSGVVTGTPRFMAPEQARGEAMDHRADLFSLGSVLYTLCTGDPPFRASTTMGVLRQVCEDSPPPISQVNPEIPAWLIAIIATLHAKDPADRFQTAAEVAGLLGGHLAQLQEPARVLAPAARRPVRRRAVAAAIVLALLLGGFGAAESAGITRLAEMVATVLRIPTPQGTLVVEIDDPAVKVSVDNDGDEVVIHGAGAQEVRLRPGRHQVQATRDGKPVLSELITITQGGKQTVKVSREPAVAAEKPANLPTKSESPPAPAAVKPEGRASEPRLTATYQDQAPVFSAEFAPDGKTLAIACTDKTIKLWDVATRTVRATLNGHEDAVVTVAYAPDGKILASAGMDKTVRLWDTTNGRELATLRGHEGDIRRVAFSPDGTKLASASRDQTAKIWDVATRKEALALVGHPAMVTCAVFSPDGKTVATGAEDSTARLWDTATGRELTTLEGSRNTICSLAFSPKGGTLYGGSCDFTVKVWNVDSRALRNELTGHRGFVRDVATSPDGKLLVTGGNDGFVRIWDPYSGLELAAIHGHEGTVKHVAFSPDGKTVASASLDWTAKLWDVSSLSPPPSIADDKPPTPLAIISVGELARPRTLAIAPDGKTLVAAGTPHLLRTWDISDPARPGAARDLQGFNDEVTSIAFSPDGKTFVAGCEDKTIPRWDTSSWTRVAVLKTHLDTVTSVAFSPRRPIFASGSRDRTFKFWDAVPWTERSTYRNPDHPVLGVAFSPDDRHFAVGLGDWDTGEPGEVRLGMGNGQGLSALPGTLYGVKDLTFSPDSKLVAAGSGTPPNAGPVGTVTLWDVETRQIRDTIACPKFGISLAFSPDGKTLAVGQFAGRLLFYDIASKRGRSLLAAHPDATATTARTPGGRRHPPGMVLAMTYSPDGKILVTAGAEGILKLWNVPSEPASAGPEKSVLRLQLERARDRLQWAERMHTKGYVSAAQLARDRLALELAKCRLEK